MNYETASVRLPLTLLGKNMNPSLPVLCTINVYCDKIPVAAMAQRLKVKNELAL